MDSGFTDFMKETNITPVAPGGATERPTLRNATDHAGDTDNQLGGVTPKELPENSLKMGG